MRTVRAQLKGAAFTVMRALAHRILDRFRPTVVSVTGSYGKTSAREAIAAVLGHELSVRSAPKNLNTEFGVLLTVFGATGDPEGRLWPWIVTLARGLFYWLFSDRYPKVLVLEYGIDRPGDMERLLSVAVPNVAVITAVGTSHAEFLGDASGVELEKGKLAEGLQSDGTLILNADEPRALRQRQKTKAKTVITYGESPGADVSFRKMTEDLNAFSTSATLSQKGGEGPQLSFRGVGRTHRSAALAAAAVAGALGLTAAATAEGLKAYRPSPGRLNVIAGIKRTLIIDDSYNAAPESVAEALGLLARIPREHKVAVLGDMLEIGSESDRLHREIGQKVAAVNPDRLITIGPSGKLIADGAREAGLDPVRVLSFDTSEEAGRPLQNLLVPGTVVLVKASQGIRAERVTKEILAEPMRVHELLCRQYGRWLKG